jgi:predicted MFS family arabinose efflux permease
MRRVVASLDRHMAGLLAINVLSTAYLTLAPAFVGAYVDRLHLAPGLAGLITSAQLAGAALGGTLVLLGFCRVPAAALLRLCAVVMGCADLACSALASGGALAAGRVVAGAAAGVGFATVNAAVGQMPRPAAAYGAMLAAQMLFGIAGYLSMPALLDAVGLRGVFILLGALAMLSVPLVRALPARDVARAETGQIEGARAPRGTALTLASLALLYVANSAVWTYLDRIGVAAGLGQGLVSIALAVCMVSGLGGVLLVPVTSSRIRPATAIVAGTLLMAGCTALLWFSSTGFLYLLAVAGFNGMLMYVVPFYLASLASGPAADRSVKAGSLAIFVGLALGPVVGSRLVFGDRYDVLIWSGTLGVLGAVALAVAARWRQHPCAPDAACRVAP